MPHKPRRRSVYPSSYVSEFLRDLADSGLTEFMQVNGSVSPVTYTYAPSRDFILGRALIFIQDNIAFGTSDFGAIAGPLTNGVSIQVNGIEIENWKSNVQVMQTAFDINSAGDVFGAPTQLINARWTFYKASGDLDGLFVPFGDAVTCIIQDDLSTLLSFCIKVQGELV